MFSDSYLSIWCRNIASRSAGRLAVAVAAREESGGCEDVVVWGYGQGAVVRARGLVARWWLGLGAWTGVRLLVVVSMATGVSWSVAVPWEWWSSMVGTIREPSQGPFGVRAGYAWFPTD